MAAKAGFSRYRFTGGLILLILGAFALRLHRLDAVPFRGDEAYSVMHWTATPFSDAWETLILHEPAPVGAFTLYWVWNGLVGTSEFATRYLSLLGNVAGLAVVVTLARRLLRDPRLALLAGVLWMTHPFLIWHAQDARTYGVLSALTPLTFYWLLRATAPGRGKALPCPSDTGGEAEQGEAALRPYRRWWPYIGFQTAAIYLYYFEPFWMVAQLLYVLSLRRREVVKRAIVAWSVVTVLVIPVAVQWYALMFRSHYAGNAASADFPALFSTFVPALLLNADPIPVWVGVLFVGGIIAGLLCVHRHNRAFAERGGLALLFWIVVPPLLLYGASFFSNFFRPRYVTMVIPALIIALVAVGALATRRQRFHSAAALTLILTAASVVQVYGYFYRDPPKAGDLPGLMAYLHDHTTPRDVVVFSYADPALEYYYTGQGDLLITTFEWSPTPDDVTAMLETYRDIVVFPGEGTAAFGRLLHAQAQHIPGDSWPSLTRYRHWVVQVDEIETALAVTFGDGTSEDVASLRGVSVIGASSVLLYWEALAVTEGDYSVLLHLESPGGEVIALDHAIAQTIVSTRTWTPGVTYRDPVALPLELPAGKYVIYAGFKTPSGDLLPAAGGDDSAGRVAVGTLTVPVNTRRAG